MRHRGPDDAGEWWSADGRAGLGHRRLSVIDLSPAGHQPMIGDEGGTIIVFNGEIYNFRELRDELIKRGHRFCSRTDTEVILAAYREWGVNCLSHLDGMFAFALYNSRKQQLFLARDRVGEKPLFYSHDASCLRFASELKGLMADTALPRKIDPAALDCYLAMGFAPGDMCILKGVKKLPPAHALLFDLETGASRVWRYWELPKLETPAGPSSRDDELLAELQFLLENAVRRQLVSDVPVGILLSGGVDSSLITAMAASVAPRIRTFTIRFSGHQKFDETKHARLVSEHFGTEHVELQAAESTVAHLPCLARQIDEPIVDSSVVPTFLVSQLVRGYCTVALGGDGGDELFGGYPHYDRLLRLQQELGWVPSAFRLPAAKAAELFLPLGFKASNVRTWLMAAGADLKSKLPLVTYFFDPGPRRKLMAGRVAWALIAEEIRDRRLPITADLLQRATRTDFENYLSEDILVKVDRTSMLNSLEIRAPFLDRQLVEFAFGKVPSHQKATPTGRKILLKKLAARLLPKEFDQHRKQGFSIPLTSWLISGPWQEYFHDVLLGSSDMFFDKNSVRKLLSSTLHMRENSERLFALVMFELWRREYKATL
jgi:asparagine synthase (glutamine-hydrolysing)